MERRFDSQEEDVQEVVNVVIEPTRPGMDAETVSILIADRIATGG